MPALCTAFAEQAGLVGGRVKLGLRGERNFFVWSETSEL